MTSWFGLQLVFVPSVRFLDSVERSLPVSKTNFAACSRDCPRGPLWSTEIIEMYIIFAFVWQFSHVLFMVFVPFCSQAPPFRSRFFVRLSRAARGAARAAVADGGDATPHGRPQDVVSPSKHPPRLVLGVSIYPLVI
jgi:hypothetical protein